MMPDETCDVCWASHGCDLPVRHEGDHACIDEDDEGEPHETCPRTGPAGYEAEGGGEKYLYQLELLRYHDGDFCDICGPIDPAAYVNPLLDHAMRAHPERWARDYADWYKHYLGDGQWAER